MKRAVTLSILGLAVAAMPAFACGDKDCSHNKGHKGAKGTSSVPAEKPLKEASKPSSEQTVAAPVETKAEAK
jgi:hypothetical protein